MHARPGKFRLLTLAALAASLPTLLAPSQPALAQDDKPVTKKSASNEPPPFDPKTAEDGGLGMPSPYDKFVALDQVLSKAHVNWRQYFSKTKVDVDVDEITETKVALPTLLGFRISDGVMAIKAHDAELLNKCASDIEAMAKKLGVGDTELARAKKIRSAANAGEWLKVFMELGFLQQDIMKTLDKAENKTQGTLVIVGGWLQGARYVTSVIKDNYSPETSNYLREPMLVGALLAKLQTLPADTQKSPIVEKMVSALTEIKGIVDIKLDGSIPADKVDRVKSLASEVVTVALASSKK